MPDVVGIEPSPTRGVTPYFPPSAPGLILGRLVPPIPKVASGRVVAPAQGWQVSAYIDTISKGPVAYAQPPALLIVAESREGWFAPKEFRAPALELAIPPLELPKVPTVTLDRFSLQSVQLPALGTITVPAVTIPGTPDVTSSEFDGWMQENMWPLRLVDQWGPAGTLNWARDLIRVAAANVLARLWNTFIVARVNGLKDGVVTALKSFATNIKNAVDRAFGDAKTKIEDSVNGVVKDAQKKLDAFRDGVNATFNAALEAQRTATQNALDKWRAQIEEQTNAGLRKVTDYATEALNSVVPNLWAVLGLPPGTLVTAIPYRAHESNFEYWAPATGTVIHYFAIGS